MSDWTKAKANRLQEFAHEREIVGDMDSARLMWAALSEITRLRAAVEARDEATMSDRHSTEYLQAMAILRDWRAEKVHRKRIQEQTQWWYLTLHDLFLEIERLRAAVEKLVMHFGSCIDHGSRCVLPHKWHVEHCDDGNVCTQCVRDWLESELEGGGCDE